MFLHFYDQVFLGIIFFPNYSVFKLKAINGKFKLRTKHDLTKTHEIKYEHN